jgi:hypothetical protein
MGKRVWLVAGLVLAMAAPGCSGDDHDTASSTTVAASSTSLTAGDSGPRPALVDAPAVPMAFDEQSGVVVALVDEQTWTFNVETLTWAPRSAAGFDDSRWYWTRLVYDPATDLTVAVTELGSTYVYDADSDTWTQRSSLGAPGLPGAAALDARTNRIVVVVDTSVGSEHRVRAWSYTVTDDRWEEATPTEQNPSTDVSPLLMGYAPPTGALVAVSGAGPATATHTFAADVGVWEQVETNTPDLGYPWGDLASGTEAVYASVTDRLIVFTDGVTAEYDPVEQTWVSFTTSDSQVDGVPVGRLVRLGATLVYDSVNKRVLMYGGKARTLEGWQLLDDLWAYDPTTHEWSLVLDSTQALTGP